MNKSYYIHPTSVVDEGCEIGLGTKIWHFSHIMSGCKLGENCNIGANCTIGGVGFGYEKDETGDYELIPHIENVIIKDNVEIGNNTTIDRAVMGSTVLEENVKVDNLVHIAHGVKIGRNSMIIANAMIAGSVELGENVWIAPSSSIINGVSIGKNTIIGMGTVILKQVGEKDVMIGNPGRSIKKI